VHQQPAGVLAVPDQRQHGRGVPAGQRARLVDRTVLGHPAHEAHLVAARALDLAADALGGGGSQEEVDGGPGGGGRLHAL
jgi:hypothetical protein